MHSVPVRRKIACESLNMFFAVDIAEQLLKLITLNLPAYTHDLILIEIFYISFL